MIPTPIKVIAPLLVAALIGGGAASVASQATSPEPSPQVTTSRPLPQPVKPVPMPKAVPLPSVKPVPLPKAELTPPTAEKPVPMPTVKPQVVPPEKITPVQVNLPKNPAQIRSYAPGFGKTVALTFDDGPGPSTQAIIDVLRRYNVPATFFNVGQQEAARAALVQEEARLGYTLGNHTWDHADLTKLPQAGQAQEIGKTQAETQRITGVRPPVFRPPYGSYDGTTQQVAAQDGMTVWTWSVDTEDWRHSGHFAHEDVTAIVNLAEQEGIKLNHPVILMHNNAKGNPATVEALHIIIEYFQARGYTFVALS